jgi:hypothetical protein
VGDIQYRHFQQMQNVVKFFPKLLPDGHVQAAHGFVQQHGPETGNEGAGQGQAALIAPAELGRSAVKILTKPHKIHHLLHPSRVFPLPAQAVKKVLPHAEVGKRAGCWGT